MNPPPGLQDLIDTVRQDSGSDDPLDQLATAASTVSELEATNDALLGHFVDRCRRSGQSWSQISAALGVSKQAVHKRFSGPIADRLIESKQPPTFERFTSRARTVLVTANAAARAGGRAKVDAEDLLIGLFAEPEGLAARALTAMEVTQAQVDAALRDAPADPGGPGDAGLGGPGTPGGPGDTGLGGPGTPGGPGRSGDAGPAAGEASPGDAGPAAAKAAGAGATPTRDRLPYSAPAANALRDALVEALEFGHNYIGTEHILLGLIRDPDSPAAQLLAQLGATSAETKVRLAEMLRGFTKPPANPGN